MYWDTLVGVLLFSPVWELVGLLFLIFILTRLDERRSSPGRLRSTRRVNPQLHSLWWEQRPSRKELRKLQLNLDWPLSLEENAAVVLDELESAASSSSQQVHAPSLSASSPG